MACSSSALHEVLREEWPPNGYFRIFMEYPMDDEIIPEAQVASLEVACSIANMKVSHGNNAFVIDHEGKCVYEAGDF